MVLVLLSCGREPTTAPLDAPARFARGLSFNAIFPQSANMAGIADLIEFNRVRVVLRRTDGSVALDTTVTFPPGAEALTVSFDIRLSPGTPPSGELLMLDLAYLNSQGDTVWRGGPVEVLAVPALAGQPPPAPVSVNVVYTGPGAAAKTVRISPRTLSVNTGASFAFTADGLDASGAVVANAPIGWSSLDPTRATVTLLTAGNGNALGQRGTARIVAQLINGAADTVTLTINAVPTTIAAVSGNGQTGIVGKPTPRTLAQPLVVRVTAADGLGVAGVSVAFAAANGGSVNPATATTDSSGNAQTTWTLGPTALSQTATAAVAGLGGSPVTFTATGQLLPATKLALTTAPTAGSSIPSGTPIGLVVTAQDVDGDPASSFTGTVTVALSVNPAGGTLAGTTSASAVGGVASFPNLSIAKPGTGYVLQATSGSLASVSTPAFNVTPGALAVITITPNPATMAINATQQFTAAGTDAGGNVVAITPTWTVVASGGTIGTTTGLFTAGATAGTFANTVTATSGTISGTATVTVTPGALAVITIMPNPATMAINATQQFTAAGKDAGGNVVAITPTWSVVASGGTITTAGSFTAGTVPGTFLNTVKATSGTLSGTADVVVTPGPLASITVTPNPDTLAINGIQLFTAVGRDVAGNPVAITPTWTVVVSGGTIGTTGLFTAGATAGTFTNTVKATSGAISGTATVTVTPGALSTITVTPNPVTMGIGLTQQFTAVGKDAGGNVVAITPTWTVVASGGTIGTTGLFTAGTTAGTFANTVTATSGTISGTATVTVTPGAASQLVLTTNAAGALSGAAFTTQPVVAVRDALGNTVTTDNSTVVTMTVSTGATVVGTATATATAGVATFTTVGISGTVGTSYTLTFAASGLTSATSASVTVTSPPPAGITLALGTAASVNGVNGTNLDIPIVSDMTNAQGQNLASLTFNVTWDAAKFDFVSTTNGTFGTGPSFTVNTTNTGTGVLSVSVFDTDGFATGTPTIFTVTLTPKATATSTPVTAVVSAAGSDVGNTIANTFFTIRPVAVTVP